MMETDPRLLGGLETAAQPMLLLAPPSLFSVAEPARLESSGALPPPPK